MTTKKLIFMILALFVSKMVISQDLQKGKLNEEALKQIKASFKKDAQTKALINASTSNDAKTLVLNRENLGKNDHLFSNQVKSKGITDQKQSGRCWLFTGLNVVRPIVIDKFKLDEFEFSQNYSFFWDQLEKANLFLEAIITTSAKPMDDKTVDWLFKNAIGDGGNWAGFVDVAEKYGVVPKSVMPETNNSDKTSMMSSVLTRKLREDALELRESTKKSAADISKRKIEMLSDIYRILVISLGEPPEEFTWRYKDKEGKISESKTYSPKSFYKEFVGVNLKDYVMIMNDPTRDYYKVYEIEYDRNMIDGTNWKYLNLPVNEIKDFAKASILDNQAMYFSCDVGKQLNSAEGILDVNNYDYESLYGVKFNMDKAKRIKSFDSGSSHGMALMGVDLDASGKPLKWLLENSWGSSAGNKGTLTMTDKWFDEYMFRIVINKKFINEKTMNLLEQKSIMLPPWDPMFAPEQ
ncbi:MAG: C1 family peptidase [Bacteroidetes bacterium]|nr:C1 family peptidase [Bacteroidota bacterium]